MPSLFHHRFRIEYHRAVRARSGEQPRKGEREPSMPENSAYVTDACERLLEALLSDRGLKNLVEVAADALGNPVLVADPTYRYAARAGFELEEDDESTFAQVTRRELAEDDTILDEGVRYIIETGVDEELARSRGNSTPSQCLSPG